MGLAREEGVPAKRTRKGRLGAKRPCERKGMKKSGAKAGMTAGVRGDSRPAQGQQKHGEVQASSRLEAMCTRKRQRKEDEFGILQAIRPPPLSGAEMRSRLAMASGVLPEYCYKDWDWRAPCAISVGSDFAGINCPVVAMKILRVPFQERFVCESDAACMSVLEDHFPDTGTFYGDITKRDNQQVPYVDLYFTTFPCQPFSGMGKCRGESDVRGTLWAKSIDYMQRRKPRLVVMENVVTLASRFPRTYKRILQQVRAIGYGIVNADSPVTNTKHHGVPQSRPRIILICVRRDSLVSPYKPPRQLQEAVALRHLLGRTNHAGSLPQTQGRARDRVERAYAKARSAGHDPARDVVVTDVAASDKFAGSMVNLMPCITATRGSQRGFHVSTTGDRITTHDMVMCHGLPPRFFDPKRCHVGERQFGKQLGNAISCNVMMRIIPRALLAAGLIRSAPEPDYWEWAVGILSKQGKTDRV